MQLKITEYALCQDCLKVHKGKKEEIDALAAEEKYCECGGQVCNCPGCANSAMEIERIGIAEHVLSNPGGFAPEFVNQLKNGSSA